MGFPPMPTNKIIGYHEQRKRLDSCLTSKVKFIIIEGELGSGKTTVMREAMAKYAGVRVVGGSKEALAEEVFSGLAANGILPKLQFLFAGASMYAKFNVFKFLESYKKPLVLYFDENREFKEIVLDVKNVVADNDNLQTVLALTPSQREVLYGEYPEFVKRIGSANRIVLTGLSKEEKKEFVGQYATMEFADRAFEVVQRADYPLEILDMIRSMEASARNRGLSAVTAAVAEEYIRPEVPTKSVGKETSTGSIVENKFALSPLAQKILEEVTKHPGIEPSAVAEKVGASVQGVYNQVSKELKPRSLVVKQGRKLYPFRDPNPKDLGA